MSTPLPPGLDSIERALESTTAPLPPALRARVLAAARAAEPSPRARGPWFAASAAAAVLLLLNLARSATFNGPLDRAAPSPALCAQLRARGGGPLSLLTTTLPRACEEHAAQSPE